MAATQAKSPSTKKRQRPTKQTVFLSGTDRVRDVMAQAYDALKRMGFTPWWFPKHDFPHLADNAMDACLAAARVCDRLILILDERAGLSYKPTGTTITEAEFNEAHNRAIPCLVFVRTKIWYQSRVYHRHLSKLGSLDKEAFASMMLDGDQEVYEFVERIQHKVRNGKPAVPWITSFEVGADVVRAFRAKWLIADKDQMDALVALRRVAERTPNRQTPNRGRVGHILFTQSALSAIRNLPAPDRKLLVRALQQLERGAAHDPKNPLAIHLMPGLSSEKRVMQFRAGKLRIFLSPDTPDGITIFAIVARPSPRSRAWRNRLDAALRAALAQLAAGQPARRRAGTRRRRPKS